MKFSKYLYDKLYSIIIIIISFFLIILLLIGFKVPKSLIIAISIIYLLTYTSLIIIDYFRKKEFYNNLLTNIKNLDKSYLVLETVFYPSFYEGKLLYQALYDVNKSMNENVKIKEEQLTSFKEYIEMWVHEVKIPLASISLTLNNHKNKEGSKIKNNLKRIEDYVNQVLYYARMEFAEKDYYINEINLSKVIKNISLRNMPDLLESKIDYQVENVDVLVLTDSKWLEYILNQVINNSIKYKRNIKHSYIKIYAIDGLDKTTIVVEDNGIGIPSNEINQVFDKTFTGSNGRKTIPSTGMGLYIVKNLCQKLGHKILIDSKENEYTKVSITIAKNKYFDVLK